VPTPVTPTPTKTPSPTPTNTRTPTVTPFVWQYSLSGLNPQPLPQPPIIDFDDTRNDPIMYVIGYLNTIMYYNGSGFSPPPGFLNTISIRSSISQYGFSAGQVVMTINYPTGREGTGFAFRFDPSGPAYSGTFTNGTFLDFP